MFRQILSTCNQENQYNNNQELNFPYLNQLIKAEPINQQKNVNSVSFAKINSKNNSLQISFEILEQFKNEKIKFITNLQQATDSVSYIEISQNPIHIDNGCNFFLLNAFWSFQNQGSYSATKSKGSSYAFSGNISKGRQAQKIPTKEAFFNLIYLISSITYVEKQILSEFLNSVKSQNKNYLRNRNVLKVINYQKVAKTGDGIVSTAAETKFHNESDIFDDQLSLSHGKSNPNNRLTTQPNQSYSNNSKSQRFSNSSLNLKDKLFSRTSELTLSKSIGRQTILNQISLINQNQSQQQYFLYNTIEKFNQIFMQSRKLLTLQELSELNSNEIIAFHIQKILENYQNSMEFEFDYINQKTIDQIKQFSKDLFDKSLMQFYDKCQLFCSPQIQSQFCTKLLNKIYQSEKKLFQNINKGKRQVLNRRISSFDDQSYADRSFQQNQTKFSTLLGQKLVNDQQMGYGVYRESIKEKVSDIFGQLIDQKQNKGNIKGRKGKFLTKAQFSTNVERRIQLLLSQKRNLEQNIGIEQKIQQNLVQYLKGLQVNSLKRDFDKISEQSENS